MEELRTRQPHGHKLENVSSFVLCHFAFYYAACSIRCAAHSSPTKQFP